MIPEKLLIRHNFVKKPPNWSPMFGSGDEAKYDHPVGNHFALR